MTRRWRFRDDGTEGEELSGIPNGFREFVVAVSGFAETDMTSLDQTLSPDMDSLLPNTEWLNRQYTVSQMEKFPGIEGYDDPEAVLQASASPQPDLSNHHNALACPYCNPEHRQFAAPPQPDVQPINGETLEHALARCILADVRSLPSNALSQNHVVLRIVAYAHRLAELLVSSPQPDGCPTCGAPTLGPGERHARMLRHQTRPDFSAEVEPPAQPDGWRDIKYGTLGVPLALRREPTEKDFADPRFDVLWELMKRVDVDYCNGLFSGATGNDVCAVLDALDSSRPALTTITRVSRQEKS